VFGKRFYMWCVRVVLLQGEATVPSLLADELATNPFLRPHDAGIRAAVKADAGMPDWEVFGRVRTAKDQF
jgi:hydroxyacylglutathione hydrolase